MNFLISRVRTLPPPPINVVLGIILGIFGVVYFGVVLGFTFLMRVIVSLALTKDLDAHTRDDILAQLEICDLRVVIPAAGIAALIVYLQVIGKLGKPISVEILVKAREKKNL